LISGVCIVFTEGRYEFTTASRLRSIYSAIARVRNGLDSVTAGAAPRGRKGQFPLGWRIAQLVS
jgi:hypothetical protein